MPVPVNDACPGQAARDVLNAVAMQTFWQDLSLAGRLLRKSPGFTAAAVLTIAIGIGANATIFSLADAVFLRPLPVADADRIVHISQRRLNARDPYPLSYSDYVDYRTRARSFEALAAHYSTSPMHLVIDGDPQAGNGAVVTANYFELLKLQPAMGRFFRSEEDTVRDRDAVAVISHALWQQRFGGSGDAIGRTIRVNDRPFTILGVAPGSFGGVHNGDTVIAVWIPASMFRFGYRYCDALLDRGCTIVHLLGKLKSGTSMLEAQRELDVIAQQLALEYPNTNKDRGVMIVAARGRGYASSSSPLEARQLQLFTFAVALVLLIGCANVAGLLLARAVRRRKEIAVRLALGATRQRLIRQLFSESLLIAVIGGGVGLLLAVWTKDFVGGFNATDYAGRPRDFRLELSGPVLAATTAVTMLASILFGLVPALQGSKPDILTVLKDEGVSGGLTRAKLRQVLVVGQIGLAVMLVIGAGLFVQSLRRIVAGPGFDPRPVITLRLRPGLLNYSTERALAVQRQIIARLESIPGVVSASPADGTLATPAPPSGDRQVVVRGAEGQGDQQVSVRDSRVGPRYFETLGVPVIQGREFDNRDDAHAPKVVVVNDVLAKEISPNGSVVGTTLMIGQAPHDIVGVVKDTQYYTAGQTAHGVVYRSYWQPNADGGFNKDSRTLVRVVGDARAMMATIRRGVAAVDPAVPISEDYPLSDRVAYEFQSVGMARTLLVTFGLVALFLSAVGLYGVLAFSVSQRTREIGVRIAIGANARDVARLVVSEALTMTTVGVALGIGAAWTSARFIASFLYGVEANDMLTFLAAPLVLVIVAFVASYIPARRAARVSPLTALRYE